MFSKGNDIAIFALVFALCATAMSGVNAAAQDKPTEVYGPYNAAFLTDGLGLTKELTAHSAAESRTLALMEDLTDLPDPREVVFEGRATWTLVLWFRSDGPIKGTVLLAGIGDPSAQDARFIGFEDNHLGLWLGHGQQKLGLLVNQDTLDAEDWHMASAVSDGEHVTLYAGENVVLTSAIDQGEVAERLAMAPEPVEDVANGHFGGKIAGLRIYSEALTAAQIGAMAATPPDFSLPTYEEASPHWPVQTRSQAGYSAPQDPSTLPRGKGGNQQPVAKPLAPGDRQTHLEGDNPWCIRGGWRLAAAPTLEATGSEISRPGFDTKDWLVATVPGTVLTTMIDRGVYPDPDYGLNNLAIPESLARQDYWYRVEFKAPQDSRGRRLILTFEGVNYKADIWLNGKELGGFTGAFLRGRFDVTSLLSFAGDNALAVRVSPPPHPGVPNEQSIKGGPGENGGLEVLDGPTFSAAEGWDWIPGIRDRETGIWQDVTLTATDSVEIGDLQVGTVLPKPDRSEADIEIESPLTNPSSAPVEGELIAVFDNVKVVRRVTLAPGETKVRLEPSDYPQLKVPHPRLWWPNGYGEPALHLLHVSFAVGGKVSAQTQIEFGMRELSYELSLLDQSGRLRRVEVLPSRTNDSDMPLIDGTHEGIREIGDKTPNLVLPGFPSDKPIPPWVLEEMRHTWVQTLEPGAETSASILPVDGGWPGTDLVIKVNGVRIAARGGNWGMDDSLKRVGIAHLEPFFRLHRDAHVNMIRNWMGQNTEESFYALADKYGLMVWNDFWESTQNYNLEAEDPQLFLKNAADTILRFRHHASIVVWCGRNEGVPQPIVNQGLADLVRTLDHSRYYTGSSNRVNLRNSGPYQYQSLATYYRINRGFSVELGIPSVPTLESLESFIPEPDRWPISDTWAYHDWHQSGNGNVEPFMKEIETEFGAPTGFEDFVRKAQMLDYAGHRAIFEGFAAHLWQPNSGRMIWMTQPAWPSTEWNFLSWDYDTQSSFYGVQKACESVHAQLDLTDGAVDLINLGAARPFKVETRVVGLNSEILSDQTNQVEAAADARTSVTKPDLERLAAGHAIFVVLNVSDASGAPVSDNFYWWAQQDSTLRELDSLPKVKVAASAAAGPSGDERKTTVELENSGAAPALLVKLTLKDAVTGRRILPAYYSENYISLLPGEKRTVTIEFPAGQLKPAIGVRGWNVEATTVEAKQ